MTSDGRKSSEDLIRDARRRIEDERPDPDPAPDSSAATPTPAPAPTVSERTETPAWQSEEPSTGGSGQPEPPVPTKPSRAGRFGATLLIRLVVAAAIAGGWWLFTSFDDASRDGSGEIVGSGDLAVTDMEPGDCFNDADVIEDEAVAVAAVPCSEPHDNEVFALHTTGPAFGDAFPGIPALDQYTYETCVSSFPGYVGSNYADSSLEIFTFFPTEEGWSEGDRGFVCVLYALDFSKLTGSARGGGF